MLSMLYGTGHEIDSETYEVSPFGPAYAAEDMRSMYVGTAIDQRLSLVWHLFVVPGE